MGALTDEILRYGLDWVASSYKNRNSAIFPGDILDQIFQSN